MFTMVPGRMWMLWYYLKMEAAGQICMVADLDSEAARSASARDGASQLNSFFAFASFSAKKAATRIHALRVRREIAVQFLDPALFSLSQSCFAKKAAICFRADGARRKNAAHFLEILLARPKALSISIAGSITSYQSKLNKKAS